MKVIDRYPLLELPEEPELSPQEQFGEEIEERITYLINYIDGVIVAEDCLQKRITSVENNLLGTEGFAKHAAMFGVLEQRGLLERFFEDESAYSETSSGWKVVLGRSLDHKPGYSEWFTISSTEADANHDGTTHVFTMWYRLQKQY